MNTRYFILATLAMLAAWPAIAAEETATAAASGTAPGAEQAGDAQHGLEIFATICSNCHSMDHDKSPVDPQSPVGAPGLKNVLKRHSAEWIDKWISGPEAFSKTDPTAKKLVGANPYGLIMPTLPVMQDPQNRRDIIEYLKTLK